MESKSPSYRMEPALKAEQQAVQKPQVQQALSTRQLGKQTGRRVHIAHWIRGNVEAALNERKDNVDILRGVPPEGMIGVKERITRAVLYSIARHMPELLESQELPRDEMMDTLIDYCATEQTDLWIESHRSLIAKNQWQAEDQSPAVRQFNEVYSHDQSKKNHGSRISSRGVSRCRKARKMGSL